MERMKLNIKLENNWLEATWTEDEIQIHCESFSGHPEHIQMLRNKCVEFGTETTVEQELIVKEVQEVFIPTLQEELDRLANEQKVQEAIWYLKSTDWIITKLNEYKLLGIDIAPLLEKYSIELIKREECRQIQNELGGNQ